MEFCDALKEVKKGRKIYRKLWNNDFEHIALHDGFLSIKKEDDLYHPWNVMEQDMYAYDWDLYFDRFEKVDPEAKVS